MKQETNKLNKPCSCGSTDNPHTCFGLAPKQETKSNEEMVKEVGNSIAFQLKPSNEAMEAVRLVRKELLPILEAKDHQLADTEKAFGGCKHCYGKGYGTQTLYARGRGEADMGQGGVVIDEKMPTMVFCKCDRGKQLEKLLAEREAEVREEIKKVNDIATQNGYALAIKHFEERVQKGQPIFEAIEGMKNVHRERQALSTNTPKDV